MNISLGFHPISILIHLAVNTVGRFHFQPATLHFLRAPAFYIFTFINLTAIIGGQICNHPWLTKSLNEAATAAAAVIADPICCTAHGGVSIFSSHCAAGCKATELKLPQGYFPFTMLIAEGYREIPTFDSVLLCGIITCFILLQQREHGSLCPCNLTCLSPGS